jgi:hypothetical protein
LALSTTIRETKIRRSTFPPPHHPLSRRDAVYFRSGVYIRTQTKALPRCQKQECAQKNFKLLRTAEGGLVTNMGYLTISKDLGRVMNRLKGFCKGVMKENGDRLF